MATKISFNPFTGKLDQTEVTEGGGGTAQNLNLTGDSLTITGGNSVDLSQYANEVPQTLDLNGDILSISGGNSANLAKYVDDESIETYVSNTTIVQNIVNGTAWNLPGPYTNEGIAATAGVQIGQAYYDNGGTVRVRQT